MREPLNVEQVTDTDSTLFYCHNTRIKSQHIIKTFIMKKFVLGFILCQLCICGYTQTRVRFIGDNGLFGYKDESGAIIIPAKFVKAGYFIDNVAIVGNSNSYFLINDNGTKVSAKYSRISYLGEGLFIATIQRTQQVEMLLIDSIGRETADVSKYDAVYAFHNKMAKVRKVLSGIANKERTTSHKYYGFINKEGIEVVPCIYDDIDDFNGEYAKVKKGIYYGIVNKKGEEVVACAYNSIGDFKGGYAEARKGTNYGYFDSKYNVAIPFRYTSQKSVLEALKQHFHFFAKDLVEKELNEWQKKGEFEKIETWKKRVTNETREAKIRELTQKAEKTFIETHQDKNTKFTLGEYDAENEVFLINNPKYGNLLVPVPIENAPQFKQQWSSISREIKCFIDNDTINIAEILFTLPNGEQYKYSNQASLNYEMAEIDYNFEPIELDLQTNEQPTTRGQQNIKSAKWTLGVSEVDIEIPTSNIKTDNTFAVIIANENYQKEAQVPFAVNDGRTFAEYCKKTLGIPNNNVHIVTDATLNNMKYEVRWLKQVIDAYGGEARVIFYYAGHGIPDESQKTAYLLPVDGFGNDVSTGYKLDDLYSTLGNLPSKSVTVFLDACFSGANRNGEMLASARGVAIKAKSSAPVGNMVVFSAAQGDETAYPNNEQQHGMFTYYLLKKIKETAGNVTYKELGDYVTDNVRKQSIVVNGKSQTPTVVPSATVGGAWETWKLK